MRVRPTNAAMAGCCVLLFALSIYVGGFARRHVAADGSQVFGGLVTCNTYDMNTQNCNQGGAQGGGAKKKCDDTKTPPCQTYTTTGACTQNSNYSIYVSGKTKGTVKSDIKACMPVQQDKCEPCINQGNNNGKCCVNQNVQSFQYICGTSSSLNALKCKN